jgi:hypothetical protein
VVVGFPARPKLPGNRVLAGRFGPEFASAGDGWTLAPGSRHFLLAIANDGHQAAQIGLCGAQRSRPENHPDLPFSASKGPRKRHEKNYHAACGAPGPPPVASKRHGFRQKARHVAQLGRSGEAGDWT